jgi:hypothetical protein
MAAFIRLKSATNDRGLVLVNVERITRVEPHPVDENGTGALVFFDEADRVLVKNSFEEVAGLLPSR